MILFPVSDSHSGLLCVEHNGSSPNWRPFVLVAILKVIAYRLHVPCCTEIKHAWAIWLQNSACYQLSYVGYGSIYALLMTDGGGSNRKTRPTRSANGKCHQMANTWNCPDDHTIKSNCDKQQFSFCGIFAWPCMGWLRCALPTQFAAQWTRWSLRIFAERTHVWHGICSCFFFSTVIPTFNHCKLAKSGCCLL